MYDFHGKRVLVAGGAGLIGTQLVRLLIEDGARVTIADIRNLETRAHPEADFRRVNLLDPEACKWVCAEMNYVFNLLCFKGSPSIARERPADMFEKNLLLDVNMLHAAREMGVGGYLLASSLAVYSPAEIFYEEDIWENSPSKNDWWAGWAKRMGELQAEAYRIQYGWDKISIVRPANTYGPYDDFESDGAMVVPALIRKAVRGENPLRLKSPAARRDFIHSYDVARGMILVAKRGVTDPINLGSGVGVSIRELARIIARNCNPRPEIIFLPDEDMGDSARVLDVSRAQKLGFRPSISLERGIAETVYWYKKNMR